MRTFELFWVHCAMVIEDFYKKPPANWQKGEVNKFLDHFSDIVREHCRKSEKLAKLLQVPTLKGSWQYEKLGIPSYDAFRRIFITKENDSNPNYRDQFAIYLGYDSCGDCMNKLGLFKYGELPAIPEYIGKYPLKSPYIGLKTFATENCRLFHGRNSEICDLLFYLNEWIDPYSESRFFQDLVLLYGKTGVGKSSFLQAGLIPRILDKWDVHYAKRDRSIGLEEMFKAAIDSKETVILLDNMEEILVLDQESRHQTLVAFISCLQEFYGRQADHETKVIFACASPYIPRFQSIFEELGLVDGLITVQLEDLQNEEHYLLKLASQLRHKDSRLLIVSSLGEKDNLWNHLLSRIGGEWRLRYAVPAKPEQLSHAFLIASGARKQLIILDQLEEAFTQPNDQRKDEDKLGGKNREIEALSVAISDHLAKKNDYKIILSFRADYLAQIEYTIDNRLLNQYKKWYLPPLTAGGVESAILKPLAGDYFQLVIYDQFAQDLIATLQNDEESNIAPALQVILWKLWFAAMENGRVIDETLFKKSISKEGAIIESFLKEQVLQVEERIYPPLGKQKSQNKQFPLSQAVENGLVIDLLFTFVSRYGTSLSYSREELKSFYDHITDIDILVDEMLNAQLILERLETRAQSRWEPIRVTGDLRLSHDILAPMIRIEFERSNRVGQQARKLLESKILLPEAILFSHEELQLIDKGSAGMRKMTGQESGLVRDSQLKMVEEQKKSQQRNIVIVSLLLLSSLFIFWLIRQWTDEEGRGKAQEISIRAGQKVEERSFTDALALLDSIYPLTEPPSSHARLLLSNLYDYTIDGKLPICELSQNAHIGDIFSAVFSKDGKHLLTASADGTAKLWIKDDLSAPILTLVHGKPVFSAIWLKDEQKILTCSADMTARIWDREGNQLHTLQHDAPVKFGQLSQDQQSILTYGDGTEVKVWDTGGELIADLIHDETIAGASFMPDGRIASAAYDDRLKIWSQKGSLLRDIICPGQVSLHHMQVAPEGKKILGSTLINRAFLFDLEGNIQDTIALGSDYLVTTAAFSPDGKTFVLGSDRGAMRLYDLAGKQLATFTGHTSRINSINFSSDGKLILSGSSDGTARLWTREGRLVGKLERHRMLINTATFSPDDMKMLTSSRDGSIRLWELKTLPYSIPNQESEKKCWGFAYSNDGKYLAALSSSAGFLIWDLQANRIFFQKQLADIYPTNVTFSPNDSLIATVWSDRVIRVWQISGDEIWNFAPHNSLIYSIYFSIDSKRLLTSSVDQTAQLWNVDQQKRLTTFQPHETSVFNAVFLHGEKHLITQTATGETFLWKVDGTLVAPLHNDTTETTLKASSPDGKYIAVLPRRRQARELKENTVIFSTLIAPIHIWDSTGRLVSQLPQGNSSAAAVAFSPLEDRIVTGNGQGELIIWELPGEERYRVKDHTDAITTVAYSPDGRFILSASLDRTLKIRNSKGKPLIEMDQHQDRVHLATFSPDGQYILSASMDNNVKLWDLHGQLLADWKAANTYPRHIEFAPDSKSYIIYYNDRTMKIHYVPEVMINWLDTIKMVPSWD